MRRLRFQISKYKHYTDQPLTLCTIRKKCSPGAKIHHSFITDTSQILFKQIEILSLLISLFLFFSATQLTLDIFNQMFQKIYTGWSKSLSNSNLEATNFASASIKQWLGETLCHVNMFVFCIGIPLAKMKTWTNQLVIQKQTNKRLQFNNW